MRHASFLVVFLFALFVVALAVGAQEDSISISGTFGGEATFLPAFESTLWLDLSITFANLTLISETDFTIVPTLTGTQVFKLEYAWEWLTLGSELDLGLVPPAFQSLSLYAEASIIDMTLGESEPSLDLVADLGVVTEVLPTFSGVATLDLEAEIGPLAASSSTEFDFISFLVQLQEFEAKLQFLNVAIGEEEGALAITGELGTALTVLPSLASDIWLNVSLALNDLTFTSETTFGLVPSPSGFTSQSFKIEAVFNALSLYVWTSFTPALMEAGLGFTYDFP